MNKVLITVFDTEPAAFEGLAALKELHRDGDITLYASAVIAKDADGIASVRQSADRGPVGTLVGLVGGSLVGLLGGPVGVAVGAYIGGAGGLLYDLFNAGFDVDFVDDVSAALQPGKAALIADIDETWVTPIETRFAALGGTTFRRMPGEVLDEQLTREAQVAEAELATLQQELRDASAEAKANIQAAIERQRQKVEAIETRIDRALDERQKEFDAKLQTLQKQWQEAGERRRKDIDARMTVLKETYEARRAKLEQAREHARKARELTREAIAV